jgi:hypothetical protein
VQVRNGQLSRTSQVEVREENRPGDQPDTPERYGPWQIAYDRINRWRKDGTWAKVLDALLLRLDDKGLIDRDLWFIDASVIRASRAAAGPEKKGGRPPTTGRPALNATR